jgi:hypothetical protein
MPYKHEVTDSRGNAHKRTSADRQYAFAIVTFCREMTYSDGRLYPAGVSCSWSATRNRAEATGRNSTKYWGYEAHEIIPCTPVAIGKHKEVV